MILVDANLLLYAYDASAQEHSRAKAWIEGVLSGRSPVGLPWQNILAFLRIVTNARAVSSPMTRPQALAIVADWLARPQVVTPTPGDAHWQILQGLIESSQARGPLIMDAHLAALAVEHGATLYSADQDFARFPGLDWNNPLSS